jgi:iron complex transport system substrate-binding protein
VCAPSGNEVTHALRLLPKEPQVLWLTPQSLTEIFANLLELGAATGTADQAQKLISKSETRLAEIERLTSGLASRPRVFCMEWLDPIYASGHWLPEVVEIAGGVDELARKGADSVRITWADLQNWAPEVLVITPCGFNLEQTVEQANRYFIENAPAAFAELPAVKQGRVYAVDANSYFARPGPRVVEGTELLAHLFHPELFPWDGPAGSFQQISF